ncbi:hexose kinase [Agromyces intestinalis]|uniref:Hexose kinase n=1 Tax=Agromyces intestinalis TaxID=2592652 RepID=A0A5C1YGN8_9MICO|nr:hexose kinase [Agromyces intestinalis]QEO14197.1 hexose kinase [Agromyces intestinalis]
MILTVTPNPALDLTWHADRLEPGRTHRVPPGAVRAGGKGLNVARVLHAQGIDVVALATAGGASGAELAADLERTGIRHRLVPVAGATRRSLAIVDDHAGEATVLNESGAPLAPDEVAALLDEAVRLAAEASVVAVSGSLPPGLAPEALGDAVARWVATGATVVADVAGPALLAAARARAAVLKPNRDELAEALGDGDPEAGARRLLELGAGLVVVSLGADGLLVVAPDRPPVRARLGRALRGNATGAGDAAVAAITSVLAESLDDARAERGAAAGRADTAVPLDAAVLRRLARRAVAWSASAVLMPLAGDLHPSHVDLEPEVLLSPDQEPA